LYWSFVACLGAVLAAGPVGAQTVETDISPKIAKDLAQAGDALSKLAGLKVDVQVDEALSKLAGLKLDVQVDDALFKLAGKLDTLAGPKGELLELAGKFDKFDRFAEFEKFAKFDMFGQSSSVEREKEAEARERERENRIYDQGREFIDRGQYDRAIERLTDVASMKGPKADAALYFKAYSQNKLGQRTEALTTIATIAKDYPKSRYLKDAKALEVEVKQSSGQRPNPESENDEELKIYALNALANSAPEQAIPQIEKILNGAGSPKLKERALFVLAQSNSAQAREILKNIAKGSSTPELQNRAIQYLGVHGGRESRAILAEIYSTADSDSKRRILRAFMAAGEKDRIYTAAQTEKDPDVRLEAVRQLGAMGAHEELWTLYQKESSVDVKKQIMSAMFAGGNVTRMIDLAKTEQNPELRRTAVRNLGNMGGRRTGDALVEIYSADKDVNVRKTVIQGLANQDNATALVTLARKEENIELKKEIVQRLSNMRNKVATDYMIEILNAK